MTCGIYKIENLQNGKVYIGQSVEIEVRFRKHCCAKDDFLIHKALRKYGKENFSFEIIEECSLLELNEREIYWISYYNSKMPNGYNMNDGGSNGQGFARGKPVEQYSMEGVFIAEYPSANQASINTNINHHTICDCCNQKVNHAGGFQWRYKDSDKEISALDIRTEFAILQINKNTNQVIQEFSSLAEASKQTGILKSSICSACKGKYHTAGGYKWKYKNNPQKEKEILPRKQRDLSTYKTTPVLQYDKQLKLIKEYPSIKEAAKTLNISASGIGNALAGRAKTSGGFIWKYKDK